MASARDKDTFIAHPLRAAVLIEFGEQLSEMISRLVIEGLEPVSLVSLLY